MEFLRRIVSTEPILLSRVVASVAALAIAWGAPITDADVSNAVEAAATLMALGNVLLALLERKAVYSPATHEQEVAEAYREGADAA